MTKLNLRAMMLPVYPLTIHSQLFDLLIVAYLKLAEFSATCNKTVCIKARFEGFYTFLLTLLTLVKHNTDQSYN